MNYKSKFNSTTALNNFNSPNKISQTISKSVINLAVDKLRPIYLDGNNIAFE